MKERPAFMENLDKYEIANEVLSSAIRILQTAGFYEREVLKLFEQVSKKKERFPLYLEPLAGDTTEFRAR
jgi:hypothetical protein